MPIFDYTASDRGGVMTRGKIEARDKPSASRELTKQGLFVLEVAPTTDETPPGSPGANVYRETLKFDRPILGPGKTASEPERAGDSGESARAPTASKELAPVPDRSGLAFADKQGHHPPDEESWPSMDKTIAVDSVKKAGPSSTASFKFPERSWARLARALYLRQLQVMFEAGIPLYRAAAVLAQSGEHSPSVNAKLGEIPRDLERGRLLSKALERSKLFTPLIVSSVALGEESGRLDTILDALSNSEERNVQLTRALVSRLTYPLVVLVAMSGGLVVLGHVMSRVMSELPAFQKSVSPTVKLLTGAFQNVAFLPCVAIALAGLAWGVKKGLGHSGLRLLVEAKLLTSPVIGPLLRRLEANSVAGHLALLLKAGLPLDRGLGLCAALVRTLSFREALLVSQVELRNGAELTQSLRTSGFFPEDMMALVQAGEISGSLEQSLTTAADYCAEEVERTLDTALAILEPLLIGVLGIAIGAVLLLTFVPIFSTLKDL